MSDSYIRVSVRSTLDHPAELTMRIDEDGYVVVSLPPPGSAKIDPRTELPELVRNLSLLGYAALRGGQQQ